MNGIYYSNRNAYESRPFDFIYDPGYSVPTPKNFYKLAEDAIQKTCEQEIRPIYGSMFSEVSRFPKFQYVFKTESLPISWEEKQSRKEFNSIKKNYVSGRDCIKFVAKSSNDAPIKIRFENFNKSSAHKISISNLGRGEDKTKTIIEDVPILKRKTKCTKSTQTDYRDSETQTDPWIPPYDEKLNALLFLKPERNPLIEYEVDTIEEKRKISELQQTLMTLDKRNLKTQIAITKKIEKITWLVKEKKIDYINNTRMEMAEQLLYKQSYETKISMERREESYRKVQEDLKNKKMRTILNNKERELRKLERKYNTQNFNAMKYQDEFYPNRCRSNYHKNELYDFY